MSAPPRKKLKQATIFEGFKKQKSLTQKTNTVDHLIKTQGDSAAIDLTEDSQEQDNMDESTARREKERTPEKTEMAERAAEAAEKRRQAAALKVEHRKEDGPDQQEPGTSGAPNKTDACVGETREIDSQASKDEESLDASMELFSDSERLEADPSTGACEMGTSLNELNRHWKQRVKLSDMKPSPVHTILIKPGKLLGGVIPQPYPDKFRDKWVQDYVRMPCSQENLFPNGHKTEKRWAIIEKALKQPMKDSFELEKSILKYNSRQGDWNFDSLHRYFFEEIEIEERNYFFDQVLPNMVELALNLPRICTAPIPLLKRGNQHKLSMSQKQAACLLANAFFCTFPRRNTRKRSAEFSSYPDINFNALFQGAHDRHAQKMEKIKCIIHYFSVITKQMPTGVLTFKRQLVADPPQWKTSHATLTRLHATSSGTIEDEGEGMLQVDFANKYIGGGVLGRGCVQEEIRFLICPELIVTRLFTEALEDNECLIMTGAERFSDYTGYAQSFKWAGKHKDKTPSDEWCRRFTEIVAIDANFYRANENQFGNYYVLRELEKAYSGFCYVPEVKETLDDDTKRKCTAAVATGNWGCGAFGGDVKLKALIQLMAAAEAGRDVAYFTFNDTRLVKELHEIHKFIVDKKITVGELYELIQQYYKKYRSSSHYSKPDLYAFIRCLSEDQDPATLTTGGSSYWEQYDDSSKEGFGTRESPDYAVMTP